MAFGAATFQVQYLTHNFQNYCMTELIKKYVVVVVVVVDGCCKEMLVSSVSLVFAVLIKAVLRSCTCMNN